MIIAIPVGVKATGLLAVVALFTVAIVDQITSREPSVTDVSVVFAGLALIWLGNTIIRTANATDQLKLETAHAKEALYALKHSVNDKLGDADHALPAHIARMEQHFARTAATVQLNETRLTAIEKHIQDLKDRTPPRQRRTHD